MMESTQSTSVAAPATVPGPFADPAREAFFQAVRQALQTPAPASSGGLLLVVTLALFVLSQLGRENTVLSIAILVGVLLFHELGHLAGMKMFGYRDVKMFFIPFFGAAVSGKGRGVAGWKEATVLLLGPVPGIVVGFALSIVLAASFSPALQSLAMALVLINGFNLLPVSPLDGGRFFHVLLFCRHRYLELAFALFAGLALVASFFIDLHLLPIIGIFILIGLPRQWRLRRAAESLRGQGAEWGGEPAQLPDSQLRAAFVAAETVNAGAPFRNARDGANAVEQLLERASMRPPSVLASASLMLPWLAALAAALVAWAGLSMAGPPHWQVIDVPEGGFTVLMPREVEPHELERDTPFGRQPLQSLDAMGPGGWFTVRWYDFPMDKKPVGDAAMSAFLDASRDKLLERARGTLDHEEPLASGRIVHIREPNKTFTIARIRVVGDRVYMLFAPAEPADEAQRFFESFWLARKPP